MSKTLLAAVLVAVTMAAGAAPKSHAETNPMPVFGVTSITTANGIAPGLPARVIRAQQLDYQRYVRSHRQLASATASCKVHPVYVQYKFWNVLHVEVLFSYTQQVYYCYNGSKVTYFYRYRWANVSSIVPVVHWTPWEFDGNQPSGNDCAGEHCFIRGYKAPSRTAVTKGQFHTCIVPIINGLCNYVYPVLTITVYGDGSTPYTNWTD